MKPLINLWANFLKNEKLDPAYLNPDDILELVELCELLVKYQLRPKISMHKDKLITRRQVCIVAMDAGIDLAGMKHKTKGKYIIGRGLLDVWLVVYAEKFGTVVGTNAEWETRRRNIKTKLANKNETNRIN